MLARGSQREGPPHRVALLGCIAPVVVGGVEEEGVDDLIVAGVFRRANTDVPQPHRRPTRRTSLRRGEVLSACCVCHTHFIVVVCGEGAFTGDSGGLELGSDWQLKCERSLGYGNGRCQ